MSLPQNPEPINTYNRETPDPEKGQALNSVTPQKAIMVDATKRPRAGGASTAPERMRCPTDHRAFPYLAYAVSFTNRSQRADSKSNHALPSRNEPNFTVPSIGSSDPSCSSISIIHCPCHSLTPEAYHNLTNTVPETFPSHTQPVGHVVRLPRSMFVILNSRSYWSGKTPPGPLSVPIGPLPEFVVVPISDYSTLHHALSQPDTQ